MSSDPQQTPGRSSTPLARPYLDALDRMQNRELLRADELERRARVLLDQRFGLAQERIHVSFASGCVGLLSEHTHFFNGFALLLPLPSGTAVALRRSAGAESRLALEHLEAAQTINKGLLWNREGVTGAVECLLAELLRGGGADAPPLNIAVVGTVLEDRPDAYLSSIGAAFSQAHGSLLADASDVQTAMSVARGIAACAGQPFSAAYPLAIAGLPGMGFALVDTATGERLILDDPAQEGLGWGLVQTGAGSFGDPRFMLERKQLAEEALALLRQNGFDDMTSYRDLEHRDLQRALSMLPDPLIPVVRYLVSENRRVQKLVAAIRRRDWQLLGALLLMSHAAKRSDLGVVCPEADFAVEQVEAMSMDGLYGAALTGWGGSVVVAGQPFMVPKALDRIQEGLRARFGLAADVMLL